MVKIARNRTLVGFADAGLMVRAVVARITEGLGRPTFRLLGS